MNPGRIVIVGGGAAGFFAALTCAELRRDAEILVLEKTSHFLSKVRISGGGRCNVTHACFDAREFTLRYPRGERALIAPFKQFQATDIVAWFEQRGVKLKTEADGRMFPTTDSSQTIIDCLMNAASEAGIKLKTNCGVEKVAKLADGKFQITLTPKASSPSPPQKEERAGVMRSFENGQTPHPNPLPVEREKGEDSAGGENFCDKLLLATGGCRTAALGQLAVSLGHTLVAPVPSLFTFQIETPWLRELAGVSLENVGASVADAKLRERGALLITHWGLSGPAILRLSAWGARALHENNYHFTLQINWLPHLNAEKLAAVFQTCRQAQPAKFVVNTPLAKLPSRLWEQLVIASGLACDTRWAALSGAGQHQLIQQLLHTEFPVTGKSLNKDEFVTCGGVELNEVNFKTMESKICPGLFFAGEVLDIDGITGGFNFQAAWTTGWLAGQAMAEK
jgi:predicted flavoprotein YhiN